jgi:hypothetical protein
MGVPVSLCLFKILETAPLGNAEGSGNVFLFGSAIMHPNDEVLYIYA